MNILFLRGFNNYFNRTIKKYSNLSDYKSQSQSYLDLEKINFNPNDGVATELIIGNIDQKENNLPLAWDQIGTPDYAICYEMEGSPSAPVIKFRWFVLESERTRNGQYRIALKRDVIAEHYSQIMNAPCFVEKGSITDISNPLLYNNENLTYNQIKKNEYLLKDSTGTGWIVGYMAKNRADTPVTVTTQIALIDGIPTEYYDENELPFSVNPLASTTAYGYIPNSVTLLLPISYFKNGGWGNFYVNQGWKAVNYGGTHNATDSLKQTGAYVTGEAIGNYDPLTQLNSWGCDKFSSQIGGYATQYTISFEGTNRFDLVPILDSTNVNISGKKYFYVWSTPLDHDQDRQAPDSIVTSLAPSAATSSAVIGKINNYMQNDGYSNVVYGDIRSLYNGKYVKIGSSYYRMSIEPTNKNRYDLFNSNSSNNAFPTVNALNENIAVRHTKSDLNTSMVDLLDSIDSTYFSKQTYLKPAAFAVAKSMGYNIVLSKISTETLSVTLQTGKRITYDCPANIFAIPYGTFKFKTSSSGDVITTQMEEGLALARAIAKELGSSVCYDIQLLPYVPSQIIRDLMENSDVLTLTDLESVNYDIATRTSLGTTSTATFILYPSSCKGTFDINTSIPVYNNIEYTNPINYKISNETQVCRLVSPNFNGIFEFSLAKNNGVTSFNVDYTYKPLQPYIHINPDFKFIYGRDWDDARGLICGGDFSLTFINDAWVSYENNNKNYQAIFNRQIENIDVNNQIAKEQLEWQTIAGYFGGGITGAVGGGIAGAKVGGPYGAIAGAVGGAYMGTVGAVIGGEMDKDWLARQQAENKDYAKDMYGYQLGNIKAMPYSLSRSESLTNNNKIWPVIEIYEPTEIEINNLINKIAYNGMTIMAIGKLSDYSVSNDFSIVYVQGQLIRLNNLNDDFHIADAIYQEVKKGFYIPQGGN